MGARRCKLLGFGTFFADFVCQRAVEPDHSTLTAFKRRIVANGGEERLRELLTEVVATAVRQGVEFGSLQVVDSTHTVAHVNLGKDERRQAKEGKGPRDRGARWGVKHTRRSRNSQNLVFPHPLNLDLTFR